MDPAKLKVVELRAELSQRGLDTKGNKAVLVERLRKALEEETENSPDEVEEEESSTEEGDNDVVVRQKSPEPPKPSTPAKASSRSPRGASATSAKTTTRGASRVPSTPVKSVQSVKAPIKEKSPEPQIVQPKVVVSEEPQIIEKPQLSPPREKTPEKQLESVIKSTEREKCSPTPEKSLPSAQESPVKDQQQFEESPETLEDLAKPPEQSEESSNNIFDSEAEQLPGCPQKFEENVDRISETVSETCTNTSTLGRETTEETLLTEPPMESLEDYDIRKEPPTDPEKVAEEPGDVVMKSPKKEEVVTPKEEIIDVRQEPLVKQEREDESSENIHRDVKDINDKAIKQEEQDEEMKEVKREDVEIQDADKADRKDRKRKRSPSPQEERQKTPPPSRLDNEPELDESAMLLSWYDSDLNLIINKDDFVSATPMFHDGFGYIWAGARATYGFTSGKVYYEVKVTELCPITLQDEANPHVLRVGWSVASTSMQLGEEKLSYGYGGTGKLSTGNKFTDYGQQYSKDDVVGCCLDMTDDSNAVISYSVNGENLGAAFTVPKEELGGKALFPHVLSKNCAFACNFGQEESWCQEIPKGYIFVGAVDLKERIAGPRRPEKKEDCEMVMMCGLPGAGKTYWATNYAAEHPDKQYNILGTNNLIDKMKVMGLPRRRNYHGRWEILIDKCTRALNKLLEMASGRRRNYILDQTNVYPSAQRRKMRNFYGYQRRAIVVVPTEEEFKLRTAKREAIEGKDIPDSAVLEMKANFGAPCVGESFDAIEWIELGEEEAKKLIEKYNKEGKEAGFGQQTMNKRPRVDSRDSHRDNRDSRNSRDSRDSRDHRDRRSGYPDRNRNAGGGGGGGGWRGGGNSGGGNWRDRQRGGHMRHGGSFGGPGAWRGRGGAPPVPHRGGPDRRGGGGGDRRTGNDRNRTVAARQGGGWGAANYQGSGQASGGWGQQGSWTGGQSQQGGWGQAGGWGQQQWGNWKGFGQGTYNQTGYNQHGYGNGNWGSWNQQYYNQQYWGQQQQQQQQPQTGQTTAAGGQATTTTGGTTTTTVSTTNASPNYSYTQGWQGYGQAYTFPTQTTSSNTQQNQQQK